VQNGQESPTLVVDEVALEEKPSPFRALYEHWESTQWASHQLDLREDAATFASLPEDEQNGMIWIFAHRYHAEFSVARLLAPFLDAAPDYDMSLMLATQVSDEYRHCQSVLRIYEEVFGVKGGREAVQELADANMDPVAEMLYEALDRRILALREDRSIETFCKAVFAYHLLAEGVVARTAQNLAASQYDKLGFPGLARGQKLVARDEARHIGIGVSFLRRQMTVDRERTVTALADTFDEFGRLAERGLELGSSLEDVLRDGYGVDSKAFYAEAMRLFQIRMRSIGLLDDEGTG
jgi:ribonucleotide reductase beta subunit family protein with ferritin-like domain